MEIAWYSKLVPSAQKRAIRCYTRHYGSPGDINPEDGLTELKSALTGKLIRVT